MRRELNAKNLIFSVALGLASALAVYVFFKIFSSYRYPTFFYHPVKEEEKALAKYIGKELIAVELGDEITVKGKTGLTTEAVCFDKSDGALYKAMLFDSLKEIRPLAKFKVR